MFLGLLKAIIKTQAVIKNPHACYSKSGCGERGEQVKLAVIIPRSLEQPGFDAWDRA